MAKGAHKRGKVVRSTGSSALVRFEDGRILDCRIRGSFKIKGIRTTNPVAVGDIVDVLDDESPVIVTIHPRENYIIRKSLNLSKEAHIIGANVDQAFLVATLHSPRTSYGFIDRFLVTCEAYAIEACVVLNKIDLLREEHEDAFAEFLDIYELAGYKVIPVSATTGYQIQLLRDVMEGKTNLLCGHSGAGKSSLINALKPELELRTGEISEFSMKGKHTTTFAELIDLGGGTEIIDTPGVKEFGIIDMDRYEVGKYFPEILRESQGCRFSDCLHLNEPGCNVVMAVEKGIISEKRYNSYLSLIHSDELNINYR